MINLHWLLAAAAFFLDRYRIPLLVPIVLFCSLGTQFQQSDHYFRISEAHALLPTPTAQEIISGRQNRPIIVVATAGGGIQAAVWTDQVLAGLQQESYSWKHTFADCLTLISSISGGTVGSMFFVNEYRGQSGSVQFTTPRSELDKFYSRPTVSSLDDIAWAIVYPDFFRIFFPYLKLTNEGKLIDRGLMLEELWRQKGQVEGSLSTWRESVAQGQRPAVIFNGTIPETGQPLIMATTALPNLVPRDFYNEWEGTDLRIVTAARLSATFPYATPASRPLVDLLPKAEQGRLLASKNYHVVDGGYYDDFGISSVVQWLDGAMQELKSKQPLPEVLVIQIRSFPDESDGPASTKGWFYQSYAPIQGLLDVRTTGQLNRGQDELALLHKTWPNIRIGPAFVFPFSDPQPPLSWRMNPRQLDAITESWKHNMDAPRKAVECFINGSCGT